MSTSKTAIAAQILVSGVVQGVGYRAWTTRTARGLGLSGFARNLTDGRVEIHAEGPAEALDALVAACHQGPSEARVDEVVRQARPVRGAAGFATVGDADQPD